MSLNICDLRSNYRDLFKVVTAVMSVVKVTAVPLDMISTKLNNRNTQQCVLLVLFLLVWYQGVITM